jgi:hypothetical protein
MSNCVVGSEGGGTPLGVVTEHGVEGFGLHPVSRTLRLGVMMELEVCHGSQATYAGVQG